MHHKLLTKQIFTSQV